MKSGKDVLNEIIRSRGKVEQEISGISRAIVQNESKIVELKNDQGKLFDALVEVYVDGNRVTAFKDMYHTINRKIQMIYEKIGQEREVLQRELNSARQELAILEQTRSQLGVNCERAKFELEKANRAFEEFLRTNPEHAAMQTAIDNAKKEHAILTLNIDAVRKEVRTKTYDYGRCKYFRYLYEKGFGKESYNPGKYFKKIVERLDGMLADSICYRENLKNGQTLTAMEDYVNGKIGKSNTIISNLQIKLNVWVTTQRVSFNLDELDQVAQKAAKDFNVSQTKCNKSATSIAELMTKIEDLEVYSPKTLKSARNEMKNFLSHKSIRDLRALAEESEVDDDDGIVERLNGVEAELKSLRTNGSNLINKRNKLQSQVATLLKSEKRFKQNNYDSTRSRFPDTFDPSDLITGLLIGNITESLFDTAVDNYHTSYTPPSSSSDSWSSYSGSSDSSGWSSSFDTGGSFDGGGCSSGGDF